MCAPLLRLTLAISLVAFTSGCHPFSGKPSEPAPQPGRVITAEEIADSHVADASEVLRWTGQFRMREDRNGTPLDIKIRRGKSSILLTDADTPVIVIDDMRVTDLIELRAVDAGSIAAIEILDSNASTTRFGTNAGAGAIVITTKSGRRSRG